MEKYQKELMEEVKKMRRLAKTGSEEEKQAYSKFVLQNGDEILNNYAAEELGVNTIEHLRRVLNSYDNGRVYLGFENCLENKHLDEQVRLSLVIEFYEKIISSSSINLKMKATRKLEKNSKYAEYLQGKSSSEEYSRMALAQHDESKRRAAEEGAARTISDKEYSLQVEYMMHPTQKLAAAIARERSKSIQRLREKKRIRR